MKHIKFTYILNFYYSFIQIESFPIYLYVSFKKNVFWNYMAQYHNMIGVFGVEIYKEISNTIVNLRVLP